VKGYLTSAFKVIIHFFHKLGHKLLATEAVIPLTVITHTHICRFKAITSITRNKLGNACPALTILVFCQNLTQ
jgi:hypothetical protein